MSGAPVSVPKDFSRPNEYAFRGYIEGELADTHRKSSHVIIPFGKLLGFVGSTGKQVTFELDGSNVFSITVDGSTVLSIASSADLDALEVSLTADYEDADSALSSALTLGYNAADDVVFANLTTAYTDADTAASAALTLAYSDADTALSAALTLAYTDADDVASAALTLLIDEVDGKLTGSVGLEVDVNGRIASLKLLSDGTTSNVAFKASAFDFFDGITERALFSAGGGLITINGDLAVTGSIVVGEVRWPVALKPVPFYIADGGTIQWAGGADLSAVPDYTITVPNGVALAAGEAWEPPTIQSATTAGGTLRLKISTPGTTSSVTDTTDSAGGGGDPARVMAKADSADAYDGIYNFRVQGNINVTGTFSSELSAYINIGGVVLSTWFNDGGGWDEGPGIYIDYYLIDASDLTGTVAYDQTTAIAWANAIGQHGGNEWGVSHESGGSLTDFVSVQYIKQSVSGSRTGSPNGETATILVIPKNV